MLELFNVAWQEYAKFIGAGLYVWIAYASILYIFIKDKKRRLVLAVFPAVLLLIFFNPFFCNMVTWFDIKIFSEHTGEYCGCFRQQSLMPMRRRGLFFGFRTG